MKEFEKDTRVGAQVGEDAQAQDASPEQKADTQDLTELVFIIDCSGSMHGLEADTAGGINAVLDSHRELPGKALVSVVMFDDSQRVVLDRVDLDEVKPLTPRDCAVGGCTALYDAVGGAIKHISRVQRYMPEGHKADHVIFVITTDGMENASTRFTGREVRKKIESMKEQGWEFLFLGANMEAEDVAEGLGIGRDRAATYVCDAPGSSVMYGACADATVAMRCAPVGASISSAWKASVDEDRASRGKKPRRWGRK